MNKYKIEIKEILKRNVEINANNETEALDFIEKAFLKSNMIDMDFNDLESVETKIIEKNGYEIEHLEELSENDFDENNYDNEEILNNYSLEKLEEIFQKIKKQSVLMGYSDPIRTLCMVRVARVELTAS